MSELVVGFRDEIHAENSALRHRSEENRKRCIALQSKIERLEQQKEEAVASEKRTEQRCNDELAEMDARLAGAIDTIEALKEMSKQDKLEYFKLLKEFNERTAEARWLRDALYNVKCNYEVALHLCKKSEEDVARLKEVNSKLVAELKRVVAIQNE
jgi:chromosome segregation ATPase